MKGRKAPELSLAEEAQRNPSAVSNLTFLHMLMDEDVIKILKERLTADMRADLVMEIINPYFQATLERKAEIGACDRGTLSKRMKEVNKRISP